MELRGTRPAQICSTFLSGTQQRVLYVGGLGSGLVSQVPSLSDAIGVVGVRKKEKRHIGNKPPKRKWVFFTVTFNRSAAQNLMRTRRCYFDSVSPSSSEGSTSFGI